MKVLQSFCIKAQVVRRSLNNSKNLQICRLMSSLKPEDVEFTSVRYKDKVRRLNFNTVSNDDINFFKTLLGENRVSVDSHELNAYNVDWLRMVKGKGELLLKPKTTEEVSKILQHCNSRKLAVVPQGGNTGLVGGSVPVFDEIIISTALMDGIISLDEWSGTVIAQAGCILEKLNDFVSERDLIMPLDLGAKGSCHIGGNISTCAGGLRLLRYGSLHSTVLGLEVVLPNGTVLDMISSMKKDNTGYDLKHLFIGAEGTLGLVTKVAIQCPPKPKAVNLAFLGLTEFSKILQVFKAAKRDLGEILSSCEYMDSGAMESVIKNLKLRKPIGDYPFYMLLETSGSNVQHDEEKLNSFLENILSEQIACDGTVAATAHQIAELWAVRERIAESLLHDGYVYKYDLSIPVTTFDQLVQEMKAHLGQDALRVCGYGHLGDGNIHLNITTEAWSESITNKIEPYVYEWVSKLGGSVSAEHGLGFKKRDFIYYSKSDVAVSIMQGFKQQIDPNNIMNPYKLLPETKR